MRTTLYPSFSHEFIAVSGESRPGLPPDEATRDLFARFNTALNAHGLSLDDTVRTRLWGRDRAARDGGSGERVKVLSGQARSASSSYISPSHFDSEGAVAVDLWAMRGAAEKTVQEYDPPIVPPRYITTGGLVFLSGVTWDTGPGTRSWTPSSPVSAVHYRTLAPPGQTWSSCPASCTGHRPCRTCGRAS